jgi:hypothetical protein
MVIAEKFEHFHRSIYMLLFQAIEKRVLMNRTKKKKRILKDCLIFFLSYRGIRETTPAVIELNVSFRRGLIFPRYQAIANSNTCKARKSRIA